MTETITIITPVLDSAQTLQRCLDSVAQQAVSCEHLIIDGGSSDGSLEIAGKYAHEQMKRGRNARVQSSPDQGIYDAMNRGIELANNPVIGILNADDFYQRDTLQLVAATMAETGIDACYGDLSYVRPETSRVCRVWRASLYSRKSFVNGWMPPHPTFFLRSSCYMEHGHYRLDLGTSADYELMLRMLHFQNVCAAYIPAQLVTMQAGGASASSLRHRLQANIWDAQAWRVNGVRPPLRLRIAKPLRKFSQFMSIGDKP